MNKLKTIPMFLVAACMSLAACVQGNTDKKQNDSIENVSDDDTASVTIVVKDETDVTNEVRGIAGDGTSMHSLELVEDNGDTVYLMYENNAVGGIMSGDQLDVVYKNVDGEPTAQSIINISSLSHLWSISGTGKMHIEIDPRGTVTVYGKTNGYSKWTLSDGRLVLSGAMEADTFNINLLTDDSLIIQNINKDLTIKMKREN